MACAYPIGTAADDFAAAVADALGDDESFEAGFVRDIWYATVVHFTGPLADPSALVGWVAARRDLDLGETCSAEAEVVRWRHNGGHPVRVGLATATLGAMVR